MFYFFSGVEIVLVTLFLCNILQCGVITAQFYMIKATKKLELRLMLGPDQDTNSIGDFFSPPIALQFEL